VHTAWLLAEEGLSVDFWDMDDQANAMSWLTGHTWEGEDPIRIAGSARSEIRATTQNLEDAGLVSGSVPLLIDTPPADSALRQISTHRAVGPEDVVVCPVNGRFAIDGAVKVAEEAEPLDCRVVVVANQTDAKHQHALDEIQALEYLQDLGEARVEIFEMAIPTNEKYMRESELQGRPVWDISYGSSTYTGKSLKAFCRHLGSIIESTIAPPDLASLSGAGPSQDLSKRLWRRV
jgi:hypothetical protein